MSILLQYTLNPFQGLLKDDTVVQPLTQFKYLEVNRPEFITRHLWTRSGFINCFDSTSDANCPNNLYTTAEDCWEMPQYADCKVGAVTLPVYKILGVTKDSVGSPLGGVSVDLFRTSTDVKVDSTVSDASGNYLLYTPYPGEYHYCVAYLTPNLTGATVNTLVGT